MNIAVAQYYGTAPLTKTSSKATGYDVGDVIRARAAHVAVSRGVRLEDLPDRGGVSTSELLKVSSEWLQAWDEGDRLGREAAVSYMEKVTYVDPSKFI